MKGIFSVLLLCLVFSSDVLAQSGNASVGGFVQDASQASIPGVTVTATNVQTGITTTVITNESGAYNIPSLLPGNYRLTAELAGFRTQVFNDAQLGQSAAARYNFMLQVVPRRPQLKSRPRRRRLSPNRHRLSGRCSRKNRFVTFPW